MPIGLVYERPISALPTDVCPPASQIKTEPLAVGARRLLAGLDHVHARGASQSRCR